MSDNATLVERLRDATMLGPRTLYDEAAARIEELEAKVARSKKDQAPAHVLITPIWLRRCV